MPSVKGFLPSKNGLHYINNFDHCGDLPLEFDVLGVTVKGGKAANGLCGGMIFYVRDLFEAGFYPPPDTKGPCDDAQYDFISRRLFDSFDIPVGPLRYLTLMDPHTPDFKVSYPPPFDLLFPHGRAQVMIEDEWPDIKKDIDKKKLSPIGLILEKSPTSPSDVNLLGHQHQVLVYGYKLAGSDLTLNIYDPNHPDHDRVTLALNIGDPTKTTPASLSCADCNTSVPVHCFFRTSYTRHAPTVHGGAIAA